MRTFLRQSLAFFLLSCRRLWKNRGLILRSIIVLLIGYFFLWISLQQNFDLRFKLRNKNQASQEIVLVEITPADLLSWDQNPLHFLQIGEAQSFPDSQYWNMNVWQTFLEVLIEQNPKTVGVNLFFGNNLITPPMPEDIPAIFLSKKIVWSARMDQEGRVLFPIFSSGYQRNIGLVRITPDSDGVTRRFNSPYLQVPHMSSALASRESRKSPELLNESRYINFQGPQDTYKRIPFNKILNNQIEPGSLKGKIVIIGTKENDQHIFQTPLGPMSRTEVIANITDNFVNQQWIHRLPILGNLVLLLFLLLLCIYIIHRYPHSMTFIFLTWLSFSYAALSLWIFDRFNLWLPLLSPIAQTVGAFVIFLSYQLSEKDYKNWKLEQEKVYLFKLEQMKDNFISLFSHDLKTPIAKIQAICDRLITDNPDNPLMPDLQLLRKESQELHRYIQSILQVTRVESRDFKIRKDSCDINEIINEAYERLEAIFTAKGQKVELDLEPLFLIEIDGQLVREVILNLLENASKYSPPGSMIKVSTKEDVEGVFFKVQDQGPGVGKQEMEKVFEKFYRGKDQLNKTKGSGLGLYLAKYFIELHGGSLNFKSELGKGTEVSFNLPV